MAPTMDRGASNGSARYKAKYLSAKMRRIEDMYARAYDECRRREVEKAQTGTGLKDALVASSKASIAFSVQYHTVPGQSIHIVGSKDVVGNWDASKSLPMTWTDNGIWRVTVPLAVGSELSYKYLVVDHAGVIWEGGDNHELKVPARGARIGDVWNP
mmetsp:Transcript_72793/g.136017  ORF Transcript_72793/g.136017 Transcript_72793/m.136017 type:complete len:157 (+) Transcript_72793:50-520(+)